MPVTPQDVQSMLLLNNKPTDFDTVKRVMFSNGLPDEIYAKDFSDYEENCEWEDLHIRCGNDVIKFPDGYFGEWAITQYAYLIPSKQADVCSGLIEWLEEYFEYME